MATLLRVVVFLVPIAAALAVSAIVRPLLPPSHNRIQRIESIGLLLVVSMAVAVGVERLARRLLPLLMLLKLSMLFPNQAPSRMAVARQAGSVRRLEARLAAPRTAEPGDPEAASAATILALATALQAHDRRTRGHAERVRVYTDLLGEELKLPRDDRFRLRWAALLHDIGKLTVRPATLNKPGKLDDLEWDEIRRHPLEGARIAAPLLEWLGPWAGAIAEHHERFDGKGYPANLGGTEISTAGRIVAVADAYDTMTAARSYKKPMAVRAARQELVSCAGGQFDPAMVRAFLAISLPKLLWKTGPVSLLVQLPFLARLEQIGQQTIASAAQGVTAATVVAGVTAATLAGTPSATAAPPAPNPVVSTVPTPSPVASSSRRDGGPSAEPTPVEPAAPSAGPSGSPSPRPSPSPAPSPKPYPSPDPSPTPKPSPSPSPSAEPSDQPTPKPSPSPSPTGLLDPLLDPLKSLLPPLLRP